jgi:hypothetical protein
VLYWWQKNQSIVLDMANEKKFRKTSKKHGSRLKELSLIKPSNFSKLQLGLFLLTFGVVGGYVLFTGFAAGPTVSIEAESGLTTAPATVGNDSNASGGKYVQFGSVATSGHPNLTTPIRAAFYYPWFPETWSVNGAHVAYHPSLGYYDSSVQSVVDTHIHDMDYANVKVAIASWWGPNTHSENTRIPLLLSRTAALGSSLKWAFYYEKEGQSDPAVAEIQADLDYIKAHYTDDPSYAYVNGKPVIFVYNASANDNTCALADKWSQANATEGFYTDLKVFPGYKNCANQPDSWHQYSPAVAVDSQPGYSYAISAGFWRADEATARLARDITRYQTNFDSMVASNAPWQLITTFNEWGEGTALEPASEWSSASGFGSYLDILHSK